MGDSEKERIRIDLDPETEVKPAAAADPDATGSGTAPDSPAASGQGDPAGEGTDAPQGARARAAALSAAPPPQPTLEDVTAWEGYRVDDVAGNSVARVEGTFIDQESGEPAWVLVKLGRFGRVVPISIRECAAAAGRVWVPHIRDTIRNAPAVDPTQPLTGEQEKQVLEYYGIPDSVGRGAELKDRDPEKVTAKPPSA